MDLPDHRANHSYLTDFISITLLPKQLETSYLVDLYVNKGLSGTQIADMIGASKQMVLGRLRAAKVTGTSSGGRSPENYRQKSPPYGYKVVSNKLVLNSKEIKVAKLILSLKNRQNMGWYQISKHLTEHGYVTRKGTAWGHWTVHLVYNHWNGKI